MQIPGRNEAGALENASAQLRAGMETARRGRLSLPELRAREREILRFWAQSNCRLFAEDPTLTLPRRQEHGEHAVAFDATTLCWWKITHPGTAGVGVEFLYDDLPPFQVRGIIARELLPSEYLERLILHNSEFGDDIRLEGYVDREQPSLVISQPDVVGSPANQEQMEQQMQVLGYLPLADVRLGKPCSISFYQPERGIALFDAHPGNFFQTGDSVFPIDGIISRIQQPAEHSWLMTRVESDRH